MDTYSSGAARRYSSQGQSAASSSGGSSAKLRTSQLSNLSNLSNNSITKVFGAAKPRASSASITRRNNSRYENTNSYLGGSGSFSLQQQQQQLHQLRGNNNVDGDGPPRQSSNSPINGGAYNSGGAFAGESGSGRMDSYDQIRRNYEQSKLLGASAGAMNSGALVNASGSGAFSSQRAQSASGVRPVAQNSLAASSNSAYLAMRQSSQQQPSSNAGAGYISPYPDSSTSSTSAGLSLLRGNPSAANNSMNNNMYNNMNNSMNGNGMNGNGMNGNGMNGNGMNGNGTSNMGNNGVGALGSRFGNSRGIANANASFHYGNTTAASLLNMSMNDFGSGGFLQNRVSSTELIPANYVPPPILCLKSNVSNQPKGIQKTDAAAKKGKRVCFSTPLTNSTPLLNPFMFQNIPNTNGIGNNGNGTASSAGSSAAQQQLQGLQGALSGPNSGPLLGSTAVEIGGSGGGGSGGGGGGRFPVNPANVPSAGASVGGNAVGGGGGGGGAQGGLHRPASASAALMTTATTHYLNNVNHHNNGGSNGSGAGGGNVVLNAGGIVLTGAAAVVTSSNNSRSNSPVPPSVNPPQTNTFFNINNTNTSSNNNTTSHQSKPPLFLSTLGNQNYVDSNLAGGGGGGTGGINSGDGVGSIIRPKPSMSLSRPDSAALSSVSEANTPVNNNSTSVISPRGFSGGGSSGSSGDSVDAAMFPSIRSHTPSPVPTPNGASAAGHAGHGGNNSNYAPLFSQSASPGKPLPKGMILSNSMENFASFGVNKDDHAAHSKSMPSVVLGAAGGGGGGASGSVDGKATNYNTSFTAAPVPGVSGGTSASSDSRNHQSSHQGSHQQQQQSLFQPGAQRKGSTDSLSIATEGNLLVRATPPSSGGPKSPSPKTAATGPAAGAAGAAGFGSLARAGSFSFDTVSSGDSLGTPPSASGSAKNKKKAQRPSLAEQLAHIHLNGQSSSAAKTTDELDTPKTATSNSVGNTPKGSGGGQQESFFSQSLNSAIAIGRSVVSGIGVHRTSSSSPTADLFDVEDRSTQSGSSGGGGGGGAQNTGVHALFSVPVRAFSVGSCNCKSPDRVVFFANRCEYPFHHPHDSSVVVNLSLQYADMTAVTTVGTKLRFKISRRSAQALGEIDALNSFHLVTLELTSTASMTNVREKVVPLINQAR